MPERDRVPAGELLTQMATAAVAMHELFTSLVSAGFTKEEALYLVSQMTRPQQPGSA